MRKRTGLPGSPPPPNITRVLLVGTRDDCGEQRNMLHLDVSRIDFPRIRKREEFTVKCNDIRKSGRRWYDQAEFVTLAPN